MGSQLFGISKVQRISLVYVLIGLFLLQPILVYLVTPWIDHEVDGRIVVICTLEGLKEIRFEDKLPGIELASDEDWCPVFQLLQMAGNTQVSLPTEVSALTLYSIGLH